MAEPPTLNRPAAAPPTLPTAQGNDLHQRLLERAPVLIWRSGTDGLCTWFNHTWLRFTGRTMVQEIGEGWAEGVHPDDLQGCLGTYLEAFAARQRFDIEYRLRRHDGEYRWISDAGIPFEGPDGKFGGYIAYCFEVTERRRNEESHRLMAERWDFAMHSGDSGIYETDVARNQQFLSAGVQRMLGMQLGEWSGALTDWTARLHPDDARTLERQEAQAGRFGGDEMVLMLQGVRDLESATAIACTIARRIAEPLPTSAGPMTVTASIGVTLARPGESVAELIGRADAAMYQAKREGPTGGIVAVTAPSA